MKLTRENFRALIYYDFRHGLPQQFTWTLGNKTPSETTVYHCFIEFSRGHRSLMDEFKESRPKSVVPESIDSMLGLIKQDRHMTYHATEPSLRISMISIDKILLCSLDSAKLDNRSKKAPGDRC